MRITKKYWIAVVSFLAFTSVRAQLVTEAPYGNNKKTIVGENIGLTDITISYGAPGVKGREGKIWGNLIHYGFRKLDYATDTASPWRAGANENTVFNLSTEVKINGHDLAAGRYGFFVAAGPEESTLIFSNNCGSWGSYFYDQREDALRVNVRNIDLEQSVEWLKYEFSDRTDSSSTISLIWEKRKLPFTISVDLIKTQLNSFRQQLRGDKGFLYENWRRAAQYCLLKNTNFEEALHWINMAISPDSNTVVSDSGFITLLVKAQILDRLGRTDESATVFRAAAHNGRPAEVYNYALRLIDRHKGQLALQLVKANAENYKNQFIINEGLARAYSATGDYKSALTFSKKALAEAPASSKEDILKWVARLSKGIPIG